MNGIKIEDVSAIRWELTSKLDDCDSYATKCLKSIFKGIMDGMKEGGIILFPDRIKEKVWEKVSSNQIKTTIKNEMILQISSNILNNFSDDEVRTMLSEYKEFGTIKTNNLFERFKKVQQEKKDFIEDKVIEFSESISMDFIEEVMKELSSISLLMESMKKE